MPCSLSLCALTVYRVQYTKQINHAVKEMKEYELFLRIETDFR